MANEVINLPDYTVDYQPVPIKINNLEGLQASIAQYVSRYSNLVITEDNVTDSKQVRAKLNKLKKALDDRRKEIKRNYNQPLREFETEVKKLEASIDMIIDPIDEGLGELEVQRREQRKADVMGLIAEMAPNYGVGADEVEFDPRWLNKSISNKQITQEVASSMTVVKQAKDKLATATTMITKYAQAVDVDPIPWIDQLKQGQDVQYLLQAIDRQVESAKERERQRELKQQAAAEHQQETSTGKIVDTDTGEVVSLTRTLKITATKDQMWGLSSYMKKNGIKFEAVN
ncbi:DUF1351 domain-containing protein [Lactiplantibacillus plantarum]|uniref:DUF1351 domain-containing protein n=1 Tax=Lactiplantibacillus plantarum subsp. plantarum TaxID=337330 RepID=A0A2S3U6D9_LACPN|nr:DUF1351 domain-containing protein [Lactiplantibacillus plantarum]POD85216.1 hypothetical protein S101258_01424 [Lactiplantibacillus plantarum subsp. plantarum]ANJ13063.1 hypothetical protein A8704_03260 [Lactiplantibacillus plantarum]MBY8574356.1 DUF1351 domain-containing protein [Lactiplantibacillus plantarum]MCB7176529.1 DUF1351 domain-containing protein [Lactiplantibacillus plantarum]QAR38006.1 DUF1351 domain-containing protein [Lactiplantibacillus plantarum]